jgi:hypothetical protein
MERNNLCFPHHYGEPNDTASSLVNKLVEFGGNM